MPLPVEAGEVWPGPVAGSGLVTVKVCPCQQKLEKVRPILLQGPAKLRSRCAPASRSWRSLARTCCRLRTSYGQGVPLPAEAGEVWPGPVAGSGLVTVKVCPCQQKLEQFGPDLLGSGLVTVKVCPCQQKLEKFGPDLLQAQD